ncbi:MAG: hypothetical protein HYZ36_01955 [Pedosphaera parvula]|nr:hypothetical protein [Candidatus Uhrbacteria bacterium]MBI3191399.1 hypothetical protein [Pedosphaera parvula]
MVHLTLGSQAIVRVDDLSAPERERVAGLVNLILRMRRREGWNNGFGMVAAMFAILILGCCLTIFTGLKPTWLVGALSLIGAGFIGLVACVVTGQALNNRQKRDASVIQMSVQTWPRCRELLDAYLAVNPSFTQILVESGVILSKFTA